MMRLPDLPPLVEVVEASKPIDDDVEAPATSDDDDECNEEAVPHLGGTGAVMKGCSARSQGPYKNKETWKSWSSSQGWREHAR